MWFLTTPTKATGHQLHKGVLVKHCGQFRAVGSDRTGDAARLQVRDGT